jgi:hypothetical protein
MHTAQHRSCNNHQREELCLLGYSALKFNRRFGVLFRLVSVIIARDSYAHSTTSQL